LKVKKSWKCQSNISSLNLRFLQDNHEDMKKTIFFLFN
jgi:hypothetical protein